MGNVLLLLQTRTFSRMEMGWMRSRGEPLSLMRPLPFLQSATAEAVFLRPKTCTDWILVACD